MISRKSLTFVRVGPYFSATAVAAGDFQTYEEELAPRGQGWEYVQSLDMPGNAERWASIAAEKLTAKSVDAGQYDLILEPTNLWLTIHESIGHSTELDRVLGYEANYAGTSFATPDQLGALRRPERGQRAQHELAEKLLGKRELVLHVRAGLVEAHVAREVEVQVGEHRGDRRQVHAAALRLVLHAPRPLGEQLLRAKLQGEDLLPDRLELRVLGLRQGVEIGRASCRERV